MKSEVKSGALIASGTGCGVGTHLRDRGQLVFLASLFYGQVRRLAPQPVLLARHTRTAHSGALIVRGTGCDVDHLRGAIAPPFCTDGGGRHHNPHRSLRAVRAITRYNATATSPIAPMEVAMSSCTPGFAAVPGGAAMAQ